MPSAVDWSEFSVWCFAPKDVQKINDRLLRLRDRSDMSTQGDSLRTLSLTASSIVACTACARRWVEERLPVRKGPGATLIKSQRHHTSAFKYVYAQFAAGAIGGGTATYSTHWLDTIKVKMQTFPNVYNSGTFCLRDTIRHEGVKGLYLGATPALIGQTCKTSVVFLSYGVCEETIARLSGYQNVEELKTWHHASAGAMAGILSSFVLCPLELLKCRLQALQQTASLGGVTARVSPYSIARAVLKTEGVRGLYRGLPGIWTKDVPGSFIYFGSYEMAKNFVRKMGPERQLGVGDVFLCGMFAGLCYCITHPIETVKTRVQVTSGHSANTKGFFRAFAEIAKTEGFRPMCSGIKPSMLRASIYSGVQFVTYEAVKDYFLAEMD
ncbi:Mitochondrial ornithine transporter 1 [Lamellibrachia satsuma]|nr:Mitochondrial ornithine transporter 1 [Lamellibrachia satsuma]